MIAQLMTKEMQRMDGAHKNEAGNRASEVITGEWDLL